MSEIGDLYFELSNEDRLDILHRLRAIPMNVTRLAREIEITTQECSRHMARLSEALLVARGPEGAYALTPYGRLSLKLITGQSFVAEHRDYFNSHSLDVHPQEMVARIGELRIGKPTGNVMVTFSLVEKIMKEAEEHIMMIHDQYLPSILPLGVEAMKRGITSRSVELKAKAPSRNLNRIRPDYITLEDEEYFIKVWQDGRIKPRFTEEIHIFLYINEKEALIAFPTTDGGFDYLGFSSADPVFHKYCKDVFEHYFEEADPPSQDRLDMATERLSHYKEDKK